MTADNGPEFETLSQFEHLGTKVYFTHPYSSWERAQNERHNGLLRDFIPKGMSMERFSDEDVIHRQNYLMHSSMKFMLLSVFLDYECSNSTCNLPEKIISIIFNVFPDIKVMIVGYVKRLPDNKSIYICYIGAIETNL